MIRTTPILVEADIEILFKGEEKAQEITVKGIPCEWNWDETSRSAAEAWAEGALRIATGAAATPAEKEAVMRTYFARPGDTPETIAFKNQLRKAYQESINLSLGQGTGYQLPIPTQFAADTLTPVEQIAVEDAFSEMEALLSQAGAGGQ